jgi:RNA polymerase sigma-70 factor (ECF subfamily)
MLRSADVKARNDATSALDHRVIQSVVIGVHGAMDIQVCHGDGLVARLPVRNGRAVARRSAIERWRAVSAMPAETPSAPEAERWSRLVAAVAREDRAAFVALFEHFAPRVKTFLMRSGVGEAAADELAQETLLAVWRKAAQFDPATTGATAWIFTIARNLRIDALRRERRAGTLDAGIDLEAFADERPPPDNAMDAAQSQARLRAALTQLSADQARVIELSYFEDKAHGEIARLLEIPLGTVKSRVRLAMSRLRALLDETR